MRTAERWKNVRKGEGVRYITEGGQDLFALVMEVHLPEQVDVTNPDTGEPTGQKKLAEGAQYGVVDLSVTNPKDTTESRTFNNVPHSLDRKPNTWHYA